MNRRDQGETERSKTSQGSMRTGAGPGQPDDDEGSITSGSPKNLVHVAAVVGLLFFAGVVLLIAAILGDPDSTRDNWMIAEMILQYVTTGVFSAGVLVGLGTIATARSKSPSARAVASLLSKAGVAVIVLGVAEAICMVGANDWEGWRGVASMVAMDMAYRVFGEGVLAGLALLCLRQQAKSAGPTDRQH